MNETYWGQLPASLGWFGFLLCFSSLLLWGCLALLWPSLRRDLVWDLGCIVFFWLIPFKDPRPYDTIADFYFVLLISLLFTMSVRAGERYEIRDKIRQWWQRPKPNPSQPDILDDEPEL